MGLPLVALGCSVGFKVLSSHGSLGAAGSVEGDTLYLVCLQSIQNSISADGEDLLNDTQSSTHLMHVLLVPRATLVDAESFRVFKQVP